MVLKIINSNNLIQKIFLFSIIIKIILLALMGAQPFLDGQWYIKTAEEIWSSGFLFPSDAIRDAPGTPYFYALFYPLTKLIGIDAFAVGNILVASLTVVLGYKISLEIFKDQKIANITAIIFALYPFFNFYSIALLSETIYLFLLYLAFLFSVRFIKFFRLKDLALFSFFFGLDTLVRFANLPMLIFFLALFVFVAFRNGKDLKFLTKIVFVGGFVFTLTMTPWWIRNYHVHGEFVATSVGESGKVFYSGNNPMNKTGGGIGGVDLDTSSFAHIKDPALKDKAMWEAGINWIKENPTDWLVLEFRKLMRLYSPIFYDPGYNKWYYNLISLLSYGVVFILFLIALFRFRDKIWLYSPMLLYLALLTGVHLVFIASLRYRLPVEPFMILLASPIIYTYLERYETDN